MARGTWGGALDPNIFQVRMQFTLGASHCQFGFKLRDVGVQDNTAQEVADEVFAQLAVPLRNLIRTVDFVELIDVRVLGSEEGGVRILTPGEGAGAVTQNTAGSTPSFLACNVSLKSEIRKRYGQGRFFLPVVDENWMDGNLMNNAGVAQMNIFVTPLLDHFTGDPITHDLKLVNAHPLIPQRAAPGAPNYRPQIPASWYDVVSVRVNTPVTFLRSRKIGVGT